MKFFFRLFLTVSLAAGVAACNEKGEERTPEPPQPNAAAETMEALWATSPLDADLTTRRELFATIQSYADACSSATFSSFLDADERLAASLVRSERILTCYDAAFDRVLNGLRDGKPAAGEVHIWMLYNMGYVIQTPSGCFGVDIYHRRAAELVPYLDFYASTHVHQDHKSLPLIDAMLESGKLSVEIRSLNGKNADISLKTALLPKDKELIVRQIVADELKRGSIDIFVSFEANAADSAKKINRELVIEYFRQIDEISGDLVREFPNSNIIDSSYVLPTILRMPDVMDMKKADIINDDNWPAVEACIREALDRVNEFRAKEGETLYRDVTSKVRNILSYVDQVEQHEQERISAIRGKILDRFEELKLEPDQSRLEQEMIYYMEKLDINEEKVRLRQHCRYFMDTIDSDPQPGKKLGFIAQEMGREINTTGSKANNTDIQQIVVRMKDELEKIKEQSLNIL